MNGHTEVFTFSDAHYVKFDTSVLIKTKTRTFYLKDISRVLQFESQLWEDHLPTDEDQEVSKKEAYDESNWYSEEDSSYVPPLKDSSVDWNNDVPGNTAILPENSNNPLPSAGAGLLDFYKEVENILDSRYGGGRIAAIKRVREFFGYGLKESKEWMDIHFPIGGDGKYQPHRSSDTELWKELSKTDSWKKAVQLIRKYFACSLSDAFTWYQRAFPNGISGNK